MKEKNHVYMCLNYTVSAEEKRNLSYVLFAKIRIINVTATLVVTENQKRKMENIYWVIPY